MTSPKNRHAGDCFLNADEHARLMDEEVSEKRLKEMAEFEKELEGFQPPIKSKSFTVSYEKRGNKK